MPSITLSTDKSAYVVGETVHASGFVSSDIADGTRIDLKTGPRGGFVLASGFVLPGAGGLYTIDWVIPINVVGEATLFSEISTTGTNSNFVNITITTPATLSITGTSEPGVVNLSGQLTNLPSVEGIDVFIVVNSVIVGSARTDAAGNWSFIWIPTFTGTATIHAAAPSVAAFSDPIQLQVEAPIPPPVDLVPILGAALIGVGAIAVIVALVGED